MENVASKRHFLSTHGIFPQTLKYEFTAFGKKEYGSTTELPYWQPKLSQLYNLNPHNPTGTWMAITVGKEEQ